jgi:molecular chaperone GrpE
MSDDIDIPVKVIDRRRWREDGEPNRDAAAPASLKPTYVEELEQRVALAEKQAQEFEDASARMRKELAKDAERSRRDVLASLLDVVDNLDRAIEAARAAGKDANEPLLQGVDLVRQQFLAKLDGFGVHRIESDGRVFDPLVHEAVTTVPASDALPDGTIAGVVRQGYLIKDEVLRPALVAVAKAGG